MDLFQTTILFYVDFGNVWLIVTSKWIYMTLRMRWWTRVPDSTFWSTLRRQVSWQAQHPKAAKMSSTTSLIQSSCLYSWKISSKISRSTRGMTGPLTVKCRTISDTSRSTQQDDPHRLLFAKRLYLTRKSWIRYPWPVQLPEQLPVKPPRWWLYLHPKDVQPIDEPTGARAQL